MLKKIYELALLGNGSAKVTKLLIAEKIPTPVILTTKVWHVCEYLCRRTRGKIMVMDNCAGKKHFKGMKRILAIRSITGKPMYPLKNKHRVRKDKSEWLRIEGTHEPIISQSDFDKVQGQIASRRRERKDSTTQIFAGLVKCADCGWSLSFATKKQCKTPYSYFKCSRYSSLGKAYCSGHFIRYDTLYAYVLSRLQFWSGQAHMDEEKLLKSC